MSIPADFRSFVRQLAPRFCFNPSRWDEPDDLFIGHVDGDGRGSWLYVGTPGSEAQAFALMRSYVNDAFADEAQALWLRRHPELVPERDVFGQVHYR